MDEVCCPRFDPSPWDGKTSRWKDKKFIKGKVLTLFYMPLNFGKVITRMMKMIDAAGAKNPGNMGLSEHLSMWKMNLYLAVNKEVPGAENVSISGTFLSKVYEGPFKDTGKWTKEFADFAKGKGVAVTKQYMWYTTCPKCAKKYGKNYVVLLGQIG